MGRGYSAAEMRRRVVSSLRGAEGGMTGAELAGRLGVSRITAAKYLGALAADGTLRQRAVGSVTLWSLEPGQEAYEFPADYFKVGPLYLEHLSACSREGALSLVRNCVRSGATAAGLVSEAVEPAIESVREMYDDGRIGSAEQSLMGGIISSTLQALPQAPAAQDPGRSAISMAADPQSAGLSEAAAAVYRSEGWRAHDLGDMSHAVDVLFDTDFQRLVGRVWRDRDGILVVAVFSSTHEGLNFFADSVNSARPKSGRMRLALCGRVPKGASVGADLLAGSLGEVLRWSRSAAGY